MIDEAAAVTGTAGRGDRRVVAWYRGYHCSGKEKTIPWCSSSLFGHGDNGRRRLLTRISGARLLATQIAANIHGTMNAMKIDARLTIHPNRRVDTGDLLNRIN